MVRTTVKLPKLSDTADEVVVLRWLLSPGSAVEVGMPLVVVETAKAEVEVPSPVSGVLVEHLVVPDDQVATGVPLCTVVT